MMASNCFEQSKDELACSIVSLSRSSLLRAGKCLCCRTCNILSSWRIHLFALFVILSPCIREVITVRETVREILVCCVLSSRRSDPSRETVQPAITLFNVQH